MDGASLISRRAVSAGLLACIVLIALARPSNGQQTFGADETEEIRKIIRAQLAAFPKGDAHTAFSFASPAIQDLFGTADGFMEMVRKNYRTIFDANQVFFRDIIIGPSGPIQPVSVIDSQGRSVLANYLMQRQANGGWKINGVTVSPITGQGI